MTVKNRIRQKVWMQRKSDGGRIVVVVPNNLKCRKQNRA